MQFEALQKKIKVDCESVGFNDGFSRRCEALSTSLLKLIQFDSGCSSLHTVVCALLSVQNPYANSNESAAHADSPCAERALRSFMKMDIFLPKVGSHPNLVTSGGRSCHQPPVLVNLISSTSSASLRMWIRYKKKTAAQL